MVYTVYVLEDQIDKSWYIGYSSVVIKRIEQHRRHQVISTRKKKRLLVIYSENYLDQRDATGRERFLKSGAGRKFLKKQLRHYLANP